MDYYLSTTALQGLIQEFLIGVGPHPPHPLPPVAVAPYNFDDVSFKKSASLKVIYYPVDVSISVSSKRQASGLITVGGGGGVGFGSPGPSPWIRHWPFVCVAFPNYFSPFLN